MTNGTAVFIYAWCVSEVTIFSLLHLCCVGGIRVYLVVDGL